LCIVKLELVFTTSALADAAAATEIFVSSNSDFHLPGFGRMLMQNLDKKLGGISGKIKNL